MNDTSEVAPDPYAFDVSASVHIAVAPEVVFDRIHDIERLGELSPECTGCQWLTEDRGVGARFLGHNAAHGRTWTTECEVLVADRPTTFAWHVLTNTEPYTSILSFNIADEHSGSRVTETFEMLATPRPFRAALDARAPADRASLLEARKRELEDGIIGTLRALKSQLD